MNNLNHQTLVRIPLGAVAADTLFKGFPLGTKKYVIKKASVVDPTGVAAHATDTVKIQVKQGSTLKMEHDTTTGAEGALVAGVWKDLPETDVLITGNNDSLDVNVDISAGGALNAGAVLVLDICAL